MAQDQIEDLSPDVLLLDLENPRFGLIDAQDQEEAVAILAERADLRELWNSINERGFEPFEPLVAFPDGAGRYIVVEGNRRLAAVKSLRDPALAATLRVTSPTMSKRASDTTGTLPVMVVSQRDDADDYIGFKHINGPSTWGSLAKAKFAIKLFEKLPANGGENRIQQLSRRLGDSRQLILRSLVAYKVFEQARDAEMLNHRELTDNSLEFSHLYTMLQNPSARAYLGLTEAPLSEALVHDQPIPDSHREQLANMMRWLFGSSTVEPLIKRQGTDRPKLTKILSSSAATLTLETTGDFARAADESGFATDNWLDAVVKLATLSKNVADGITELPDDLDEASLRLANERLASAERAVRGAVGLLKTLYS
jgi:hypothetical protein